MKIGVFLEDFSPEVGGGFTIQDDIFRALIDLIDNTHHSFVIFCRRAEGVSKLSSHPRLKAVEFPGNLGKRVFAKAERSLNSLLEKRQRQSRLEQLCKEAGVEFMWFVGAEAVQLDLPYMAIVWDLQHRLQPWFPEVSTAGTWRHRETFYSEFLRRATMIIAGTDAGREEIELVEPAVRALRDLGVGRGDRVVLYLQNVPQFVIAMLAATATAHAAEINAFISTAIKAATDELLPPFERANGHTIRASYAPSGALIPRFDPEQALAAIDAAPRWTAASRSFAVVR